MSRQDSILEWNITLSPFNAVFNRTISLPHNIGPGLGAIDNTTLIAVNRDTTPDSVVTLDITTTSAVSTYEFDMIAGRGVSGDILLTTTNKVIVTNNDGTNQFVTQYDYSSGSVEVDIQISPTMSQPWGIFQSNSEIYLMNGTSSNNVFHIDKNSPYNLTLTGDTGYSVFGASQVPSCITTNFIIAPTPSPTPTNTITPTLTPTPTSTPICNCYEISNTGATSGFWRMILCSATTQTITFAPPGFSTSTCIGGSNYTGSTQMSFVLKGECSDNKCPTPTPTPTKTLTPTPTTYPCDCIELINLSVSFQEYYYTNCSGINITATTLGNSTISFCGSNASSFTPEKSIITVIGSCIGGVCPTPTITPTPTKTPKV